MGVFLSLLAAASYGLCHFINGVLSRRLSGIAVGALAQVGGTLIAIVAAPFYPAAHVSLGALGWGTLAGVGAASLAFLYRGMERGQISVVAPVSEVTAVALPVMFGLAIGENLNLVTGMGVALSFPAIWLASRTHAERDIGDAPDSKIMQGAAPTRATVSGARGGAPLQAQQAERHPAKRTRPAAGVFDGLIGGSGVALTWVALSQVDPAAGLWPLALSRVVSLVIMLYIAAHFTANLRTSGSMLLLTGFAGALGTLGTGLYMFATQVDLISTASVITALYPLIPIVLAVLLLKERLSGRQVTGLLIAAMAVILLSI